MDDYNRYGTNPKTPYGVPMGDGRPSGRGGADEKQASYREFEATELYCPRCKQAAPVRSRILLALPEGDKYEYLCAYCSTSLGTKLDKVAQPSQILVPGR